jgi:5-methylcytosine-specific restriction protein B
VRWDDVSPRRVNEYGWRRTLIELDRAKFEAILATSPDPPPNDSLFTTHTFALLAELHEHPTRECYAAHKDAFRIAVEYPFQALFRRVAAQLPPPLTAQLETERHLFGRILKNDWGSGGGWDYYWGAFYPGGGKRTEETQLFLVIHRERLEWGFSIGRYGSEQRERFLRNCHTHHAALRPILQHSLTDEAFAYGDREHEHTEALRSWEEWLTDPAKTGIRVAVERTSDQVLQTSLEQLSRQITQTFTRLFPLVILATGDDLLPAIRAYLGERPPVPPPYSLTQCAAETSMAEATLARWVRAIERKGQAILYGPPGTGKTYLAERLARHVIGGGDGFVDLVQFHPAYAYEDFIQGLRPQATANGGLDYPLVPGRFLEFCHRAQLRTGRCVLIIDEINRANLSRVFGELMYLLEYRDQAVPLAGGGSLRIPSNVRLIGTMNTADRSIALVDHALRRRFAFIALSPQYDILRHYHASTRFPIDPLVSVLERLNTQIDDPHYAIGITFFLRQDLQEQLEDIWRMEIEPYLEEYFFDQPDTVAAFRWERIHTEVAP